MTRGNTLQNKMKTKPPKPQIFLTFIVLGLMGDIKKYYINKMQH